MTRLSIIIPMLGDPELMETGLVSVLENRPAGCEVLLALNGEYGNPYELDDEVRFVAAPDGAAWAESCNLAVEQAAAEIVHLLMPGVEATPGWTDAPLRHFRDADVAAVTPLVLDRRRRGRILVAGVGYRSGRRLISGRYQAEHQVAKLPKTPVLGPSRLAGFYRKSYLTALGGFEPGLGNELADVDLALRMQRAGLRTAVEPASLVSAGPLKKLPHGFRRGLCTERLLLRNAESLGKLALTRPLAWFAGLAWRMFYPPRALGHLTGQLGAWCELPRHLRYRGSLDQLQTSVADPKAPLRGGDSRVDAAHGQAPSRSRSPLRVSA